MSFVYLLLSLSPKGETQARAERWNHRGMLLIDLLPMATHLPNYTVKMSAVLAEIVQVSYSNKTLIMGITGMEMVYLFKHITFLVVD